jgi:hypothetical protein
VVIIIAVARGLECGEDPKFRREEDAVGGRIRRAEVEVIVIMDILEWSNRWRRHRYGD